MQGRRREGPRASAGGALPAIVFAAALLGACARSAPASNFPTADAAIDRMRATYACSRGLVGESKVDYFLGHRRVRGGMLFVTSRPEALRFDVVSPFGVTLSTLTSDGRDFALLDMTNKQFVVGPATECNVAHFLRVPVPPFALVALLAGEAPVLVHQPSGARLSWDSGSYLVSIDSRHGASEEIRLEPTPADWNKPWGEQRVRVTEVKVVQQGIELYRAELDDFRPTGTAAPRRDPDGIDPDVPASGPRCSAEVPRRVHIVSDASAQDVLIVHQDASHNPPLTDGLFRQVPPNGVKIRAAVCR